MGIKFGEIDSGQIIENEFRIGVLERLLESIINNNSSLTRPNSDEIASIKQASLKALQKKYPNSGINLN